MKILIVVLASLSIAIAGCGSKEVLLRKSDPVPAADTLSGHWTLLGDIETARRNLDRAISATNGIDDRLQIRRQNSAESAGRHAREGNVGGLVHVFLKTGATLAITQTESALFINFNRSIVEEYLFGEAHMVDVGEVVAQRVSGWEGNDYVIETLVRNGMKLVERYRVINNGDRLQREIVLRSKNGIVVVNTQEFRRDHAD